MMLDKHQVLNVNDLETKIVAVPEWQGSVKLRSLTAFDRDAFEQELLGTGPSHKMNLINIRAKLVARCLVDDAGKRLFSDNEIEALGKKSAKVLHRLYQIVEQLNGLGETELEAIKKN